MFVELLNKGCELFKILFVVYYIITQSLHVYPVPQIP